MVVLKTAQTSTCDRAKPRDFLEVKKPKEVGFFFFPKGVGGPAFLQKVGVGRGRSPDSSWW